MSKDTIHLFNNVSVKGIIANGSIGTTGQTLASNGTVAYWSDITGYTGSVGFTGSRGTDGYAGSVGFTGSRGTDGYAGSVGFTGSQGHIGFTGSWGGTAQANVDMNNYSINNANNIGAVNVTVSGNLTVSGAVTTVNTTNLDVFDAIIRLNRGQVTPSNDIGILMQRFATANSTDYNVGFAWEEGTDRLVFGTTPEDGSDNDLSFSTEWMTIAANGNVGIGNTAPAARLNVTGNSSISSVFNDVGSFTVSVIKGSFTRFYTFPNMQNTGSTGFEVDLTATGYVHLSDKYIVNMNYDDLNVVVGTIYRLLPISGTQRRNTATTGWGSGDFALELEKVDTNTWGLRLRQVGDTDQTTSTGVSFTIRGSYFVGTPVNTTGTDTTNYEYGVFRNTPIAVGRGFVGINTPNPGAALQVNGAIRFASNTTNRNYLEFNRQGSNSWRLDSDGVGTVFSVAGNLVTFPQNVRIERQGLTVAQTTERVNAVDINQTWNNAAATFTSFLVNTTDTASNVNSLIADFRVGGVSKVNITKHGELNIAAGNRTNIPAINITNIGEGTGFLTAAFASGGTFGMDNTTGTFNMRSVNRQGFSFFAAGTGKASGNYSFDSDTNALTAGGPLASFLANGTRRTDITQTGAVRAYGAFTDVSNFERLSLSANTTGAYLIAEQGGTGVARDLFIGANNTTTHVTVTAGGRVGIGRVPSARLDVSGTGSGGESSIIARGPSVDQNWAGGVSFLSENGTSVSAQIIASTGGLLFSYGASERMRITSAGNLLIGTTTAAGRLTVSAPATTTYGTFDTITDGYGYLTFKWNGTDLGYVGPHALNNGSQMTVASAGANPLTFSANSVERMRITSAGDVGVGTTNPGAKLDIHGSNTDVRIYATNTLGKARLFIRTDTTNLSYETDNGMHYLFDNVAGVLANRYVTGASSNWQFYTAGTERMRISNTGNIGIGQTNPGARLDITSTTAFSARIAGPANVYQDITDGTGTLRLQLLSSSPFVTSIGSYPFVLGANNTEAMRITSGGNVGIGNSSPASKLVVAGNVEISTGGLNSVNGAVVVSNTGSGSATITISTANSSANGGVGTEFLKSRIHSPQDMAFVTGQRLYFRGAGGAWSTPFSFSTDSPFNQVAAAGDHVMITTTDVRSNSSSNGMLSGILSTYTLNTPIGASANLMAVAYRSVLGETSWTGTSNNAMHFGAWYGSTLVYRVNKNGDIFTAGSLTVTTSSNFGNTTITGDLSVTGNTTLGDAAADTVTINANTITISANSNIDAGTLYIDSLNNRIGIGTTAPQNLLHLESASPVIRFRDTDSAAGTYSTISSDNTTGSFLISADSANTAASSTISFLTDGTERVRFTGTGSALFLGSASQTLDIGTTTGVSYIQSYGASFANTPLAFYTGTSARMFIAADGNVGIGNSSPARKLTVQGDSVGTLTVAAFYNADLTNNNGSVFSFRTDTSGAGAQPFWEYAGVSGVVNEHNNATRAGSLNFFTANSTALANRLTIASDGNVGIGTTTPVGRLDTVGIAYLGSDTNNSLFVNSNTTVTRVFAAGRSSFSNSALSIGTSNTTSTVEAIRIDTLGNIGIGSTNPAVKVVISNAGAEGYEINPTGGVGGGATVSGYNRSTSAYTSITTYASTMTWYANGTTRAIDLASNGNIGINTSAPSSKFDVVGGDGDGIVYRTSTRSIGIGQLNSEPALYWGSGTPLRFFSGSELARISNTGNVGIGTNNPLVKLHLFDSNAPETRLQIGNTLSEGAYTFYSGATKEAAIGFIPNSAFLNISSGRSAGWGGTITFTTDTTERIRIAANGNVGIGNTAPVNRLFVTGDIGLDGISVRDTATATTTAVTQITLFEYPIATYDSCDVIIKAVRSGERHTTKVLVTANSTVAIATEYGTLTTGSSLYTVDADISGANTRIRITPSSTTSTVFKASYELITT